MGCYFFLGVAAPYLHQFSLEVHQMSPKQLAKLDWTVKENRKYLIEQTSKICKKYNKETRKNVPKLSQMEHAYNVLCKKVGAGIGYMFSTPYIGGSLFSTRTIYTIYLYNILSKQPSKVRLVYKASCLLEMYAKTLCILESICKKRGE